jgi:Class III cytochrome C family/Ferric reductase like transmembrane component
VAESAAQPLRVGWELAQSLGLLAALCALLLCLLPVRPRAPATPPLSLHKHEWLGWSMLIAALGHVGLSLAFDRTVIQHLRLTAPFYEWAGICALLAILMLTVPAAGPLRRQLWSGHRNFQALHVAVSCALVALITVHVVTTHRYLHGRSRMALWLLLSIAALLALLRPRAAPAAPRPLGALSRLAFGRHSRLILVCAGVAALAVVPLLSANVRLALRAPLGRRAEAPPLDFPHDRHRAVNCILCHHNFRDQTGADSCISCHRSNRPEIRVSAEARFHDFCLGCHRDPPAPLTRHGPTTACDSCHVGPGNRAPAGAGV